jgi:hypothetical protein
MNKDWTGNTKSIHIPLGANNHVDFDRAENDYYATDPKAMGLLLEQESFNYVWEPACGEGHLSKVLDESGVLGKSSDLINRGYGEQLDFFKYQGTWGGDIITNPPYKYAKEFVEHALGLVNIGSKVAMFLKLTFLEGKARKQMFKKYPPKTVYVSSSRLNCAMNGDFKNSGSSAAAYAWFVWEKGFTGDPIIKWIN